MDAADLPETKMTPHSTYASSQDWKSLPVLANRIDAILSEAREKKNAGQSFEDVFRFMCTELAQVAYGLRDR